MQNNRHLILYSVWGSLQTIFIDSFSHVKIACILIKILVKYVPKDPIDHEPALF